MRGYKAKVLRRIAQTITKSPMSIEGYKYENPSVQYHDKVLKMADGNMLPYRVTGTIVFVGEARRLYKNMKGDLR